MGIYNDINEALAMRIRQNLVSLLNIILSPAKLHPVQPINLTQPT